MNKINYILIFITLILIIPNIFSYQSLFIDLKSHPDYNDNLFYLSNNSEIKIRLNIRSDYQSGVIYKPIKVKYSFVVYPEEELNGDLDISISKTEDNFLSNINSDIYLIVNSNNFRDNLVKIKVIAKLYDEYNNFIESDYKYIKIKSNNSKYYFSYTKDKSEPKLKGVNFSRNVAYILNKDDSDVISLIEYIDVNNYSYNIKCNINTSLIKTKIKYKLNNRFDINFYINKDDNYVTGSYLAECFAFNKNNTYKLKEIQINLLEDSNVFHIDNSVENKKEVKNKVNLNKRPSRLSSSISAFFNFKYTTNIILILIGIILVVLMFL